MGIDPLPSEPRRAINTNWPTLGLVLVLAVAALLRFVGLDWDEGTHLHPDERFLTMVETSIEPTFSLQEYFTTATSPLNPHNRGHGFFVYGTLPIFLVRYVADGLNAACLGSAGCLIPFDGYDGVHMVGRALSGLADLLTIIVLFAIGRRLYDDRVGFLAALLGAAAVLPIQQSHFFTVDTFTTLFVALAFYSAVSVSQGGARRHWVLFGIYLGMALACKISVWPMGLTLVAAALIRLSHARYRSAAGPAWRGTVCAAARPSTRAAFPGVVAGPPCLPTRYGHDGRTAHGG